MKQEEKAAKKAHELPPSQICLRTLRLIFEAKHVHTQQFDADLKHHIYLIRVRFIDKAHLKTTDSEQILKTVLKTHIIPRQAPADVLKLHLKGI